MTAIVNGQIVLADGVRSGHVLEIVGGRIHRMAASHEHRGGDTVDVAGGYVIPGLVDIHLHGACGRTFNEPSASAWQAVLAAHLKRGTTTALATLATTALEPLLAALEVGQQLLEEETAGLAGVHLEGPYLNPSQRGAHGEAWLREPSDGSWQRLVPFLPALRLVTLAPELAGAPALMRVLNAAGVVVSAGHSAAGPEVVARAHGDGLRHFAHLWSGQSVLTKRGPWRSLGLLETALASKDMTAELIADGVHVPAELARIAYRCLGAERLCLVSDASAGTGMPIGSRFRMGSADGVVDHGVAMSCDGQSFCGSTSFLADILRFCVRVAGIPLVDAVRMAATTPAQILGLAGRLGSIAPGLVADLVILDADLVVQAVMKDGAWAKGAQAHD